jgi:hypothetical protein
MTEGKKKLGWAAGLVAAGAVGGGLLMLAVPAAADPTPSRRPPPRPRPRTRPTRRPARVATAAGAAVSAATRRY